MADTDAACDLFVIGAGLAGTAAALFAARAGLSTARAGTSGGMAYASGCLDFLGVHPAARGRVRTDPRQAVEELARDVPDHPLARAGVEAADRGFEEFLDFCAACGLEYRAGDVNQRVPTPMGTVKTTYAVPATMTAGADALEAGRPALLVDFKGLKGFSARQIAQVLGGRWPGLDHALLDFPGFESRPDYYCEQMSQALEVASRREELARTVAALLKGHECVGLPAILGIHRVAEIHADLQDRLGVGVFEIPTMPPGIAGLRLVEHLQAGLSGLGVDIYPQKRVLSVESDAKGFVLDVGVYGVEHRVRARKVLLAGGRFLGRGLAARRTGIVEPLFDLAVTQPEGREAWHAKDFLDPAGHAVNRAGLVVDEDFRPLSGNGDPVPGLYAAGAVLAGQDWMREKCGAGLSLATARAAVDALVREG